MVLFRTAVAPLAILAASSASLVDALPSPVRLTGAVPSIHNADGTLNEAALQRNVAQTFAKLEARNADGQAAADVRTEVVSSSPDKRRLAKKCNAGTVKVPLDGSPAGGLGFSIAGAVGTPAQPATFIFDTGSYDMIVQSTTKNGGLAFDSSKSSTYSSDEQVTQFDYITGSYKGKLATDTFTIGGVSVPDQAFAVIESKTATEGVSGTLGLGLSTQSVMRKPNFFSNLVSAGKVASNQVGVYLSPLGGSGAEVTLGGNDTSRYTGKLQTLQNDMSIGRFMLTLSNAYFDGSFLPAGGAKASVLIDSGSTQSFLPRAFVDAFHNKIPGAVKPDDYSYNLNFLGQQYKVDRWIIPCTARHTFGAQFNMARPVATMPHWEIPAEALILGPIDDEGKMCATSIYGVDIVAYGKTVGILGIPFLRGQYSVFDYGSTDSAPTISFGKLA
ncbi:hypothetical protein JCM8208_006293 [Rhodotorula glutinis]